MSNPQNAAARAEVLRRPVALPVRMAVGVLVFAIATAISQQHDAQGTRIVMIAGPSSSEVV